MPEFAFINLLVVAAIAFGAPLALALLPALRLPAVVLEILAGIILGPSVLGIAEVDGPVGVLALIGLAFLLFLAGLEIDVRALRGAPARLAGAGFLLSIGVALAAAAALWGLGLVDSPLLVAIILTATSLGVIVPVLKDAGESESVFGQVIIAAASIADFGAIILLSVFFSADSAGAGAQLTIIGAFLVAVGLSAMALARTARVGAISGALRRLQDTTAQIRVRGAFVLLVALVALAAELGLEVILGAFAAGLILSIVDRDQLHTHPLLRTKLEAVGFGVFIPVFFVATGLRFDADALLEDASTVAMVPIFLAALLLARGLPAIVYRSLIGPRRSAVAGLLQATSLPFIVAASEIGVRLGALETGAAAALVAAGLLSVLAFPLIGLAILTAPGRVIAERP